MEHRSSRSTTSPARIDVERPPTYELRPAADDDFERVHAWRAEAYRGYVERWYGPWDDAWQRKHLRESWTARERQIVTVAGRPAGVLDVVRHADQLLIGNLVLKPDVRGQGIGSALLVDLLEGCARRPCPARLKVFRDNPAVRLYRRLGFSVESETREQVWMRWSPPA